MRNMAIISAFILFCFGGGAFIKLVFFPSLLPSVSQPIPGPVITAVIETPIAIPPTPIQIVATEDAPSFKRQYVLMLDGGFKLEITMETSGYSWEPKDERRDSSFLYQPDHALILFEARKIADRIIDPVLLPRVQAGVDRILALDATWVKSSKLVEYTDKNGTIWRRQN